MTEQTGNLRLTITTASHDPAAAQAATDRLRRAAERIGPLGIACAGFHLRTVLGERALNELAAAWERNPPTTWPLPEGETP